jgi:polysaccharide export outer membrane protein
LRCTTRYQGHAPITAGQATEKSHQEGGWKMTASHRDGRSPRAPRRPRLTTRVGVAALGAIALAGALGCTTAQPAPAAASAPSAYRVAPPDELRISVLPDPAIDRVVVVRPDGKISIDLVGDVQAAGRTPEEIAADVQERIARFKREPVVTVTVARAISSAVTVLGEVLAPNTFPLEKDTRVAEAVGRVGGTTMFAARSRIRVVRQETTGATQVFPVDLDDITNGDLSSNVILRAGDIVYIPPTYAAQVGYWIAGILYPFNQLLGTGGNVAVRVATGGI